MIYLTQIEFYTISGGDIMKLKKVLIIGFLCTLVVALSGCEFWEGYKEGLGVKTEKVDK